MIDDEWLCPIKLQSVKTTSSLKDVVNTAGDYNTASLAVAVDNDTRNLLILQSYFEGVEKYNRKSALIFAVNVRHVERLKALFRMNGIQACGIHSSTSSAEREDILHQFSNREIPVLINCGIK
jgi:ATP-dependent helicase IRC3